MKSRFIDGFEPGVEHTTDDGTKRLFIPSFVQDNKFLMQADENYIKRLGQLPENERRALLYGEWDIFDGQVFSEWRNNPKGYKTRRNTHVIKPFKIPKEWRRFRSFDFGYSKPFAVSWYAVDYDGRGLQLPRALRLYRKAGRRSPLDGSKDRREDTRDRKRRGERASHNRDSRSRYLELYRLVRWQYRRYDGALRRIF